MKTRNTLIDKAVFLLITLFLCSANPLLAKIARFEGDNIVLENNLIQVTFAAESGCISSWIIKATNQELATNGWYKGLLSCRLYTGSWEGGWPTEIGRASYSNSILQNSDYRASIMQSVTLTEDTFAKGLQVRKYFSLVENAYTIVSKIELINNSDEAISNSGDSFLLTIESTADIGAGGKVAWCKNGTVTIAEYGGAISGDIEWLALETGTRDAIFGNYFLSPNPQSAWVLESVGENAKDIEPHFGPYILAAHEKEIIKFAVYGGPGSFDEFENLALSKQLSDFENIIEQTNQMPHQFRLYQNYPNPFNPSTFIEYSVTEHDHTSMKIYNQLGELVQILVNVLQAPGNYKAFWDGRDINGTQLPSGNYYYLLKQGNRTEKKKMILLH